MSFFELVEKNSNKNKIHFTFSFTLPNILLKYQLKYSSKQHHSDRRNWIIFTSAVEFNLLKKYFVKIGIRSKNMIKNASKKIKQGSPIKFIFSFSIMKIEYMFQLFDQYI